MGDGGKRLGCPVLAMSPNGGGSTPCPTSVGAWQGTQGAVRPIMTHAVISPFKPGKKKKKKIKKQNSGKPLKNQR